MALSIQEILTTSDPTSGVELLLNLLSEAAGGRDLSSVIPEIIQAVFGRSSNFVLRKLAYDLCKTAYVTDADCQRLITAIKGDIISSNADQAVVAIHFLPNLPPHQLALLLDIGELGTLLASQLAVGYADMRAAAVQSLAEVLLTPDVLHAASQSTAAANNCQQYWQQLADMLLDEDPTVVAAAVVACKQLMHASLTTSSKAFEGFLLQRLASISAIQIASALGPVLELCALVTPADQAYVAQLLVLLVKYMYRKPGKGAVSIPLGNTELMVPTLSAAVPVMCSYLAQHTRSLHLAARMEACRSILRIASILNGADGPAAAQAVTALRAAVPTSLVAEAVASLLELEPCQLAEAALDDVIITIAQSLNHLPVSGRLAALKRLWPLAARLADVPQRMVAFAHAWQAVVDQELREQSSKTPDAPGVPQGLTAVFSDSYLARVVLGKHVAAEAPLAHSQPVVAASNAAAAQEVSVPVQEPKRPEEKDHRADSGKPSKGLFKKMTSAIKRAGAAATATALEPLPPQPPPLPPPQQPEMPAAAAAAASSSSSSTIPAAAAAQVVASETASSAARLPASTLRHELVCTLLDVVMHQPAAAAASELCLLLQSAALHDRRIGRQHMTEHMPQVVHWVALAKQVLQETKGCLAWEPPVLPAVTTQVSQAAMEHAAADFSSMPGDCWLQLLQAACHASRAAATVLRAQQGPATAEAAADQQELQPQGSGSVAGSEVTAPEVVVNKPVDPLLAAVDQEDRELQQIIRQLLKEWTGLSKPVRSRIMWVAAHYLHLPPYADEAWDLMTRCLSDLLTKSAQFAATARLHELMNSAAEGALFRGGRVGWPKDRPFVFDVVAASALCEKPEYDLTAVVVGLNSIQHLATLLHNALAATASAPDSAKQVQTDTTFLAARLEGVLKEFAATELASSPHIKDWHKRVVRMCLAVATYVPPTKPEDAAAAAEAAEAAEGSQQQEVAGTAAADDDQASDDSSDYDLSAGLQPVFLPPSMYPPAARRPPPARQAPPTLSPQASVSSPHANGLARQSAASGSMTAADQPNSFLKSARIASLGGASSNAYWVKSASVDALWGYPFAGPRTSMLFQAKRSRRHRALMDYLQRARASLTAKGMDADPASWGSVAGPGPEAGPALSANTMYRLDSTVFWDNLPGQATHWQELTGPADPLLLCACFNVSPQQPDMFRVKLQVTNRTELDVLGVELHVKTSGPVRIDRQGILWDIPRLSPQDMANHSFDMRLFGYSRVEVQCRLQLSSAVARGEAAPILLICQPLKLPMTAALRPPAQPPTVPDFFKLWSMLPARTELSGICLWPGSEGQALAVSGVLRQPVQCVQLQYLPAVCSYQAAFAAETSCGDTLLILLVTQLMPSTSPHARTESFAQVLARSSSPDVIQAIQAASVDWLHDVSGGCMAIGLQLAMPMLGPKPPVHPSVAAVQQGYMQSGRPLGIGKAGSAGSGDGGQGSAAAAAFAAAGVAAPHVPHTGPKVGHKWLRSSALNEWQRLASLR